MHPEKRRAGRRVRKLRRRLRPTIEAFAAIGHAADRAAVIINAFHAKRAEVGE